MPSRYHPISLNSEKCIGCTNCIKRCPTEAIRVTNEKASVMHEKCINCGVCISVCPYNAFHGVTKGYRGVSNYALKIALVDPIIYSQFPTEISPELILTGIKKSGCSEVYEISKGADVVTKFTQKYLHLQRRTPIISSSCPAIIRLIQLRFPELIHHILPIDSPVEIAAYMAREEAMRKYGLKAEEIGVYYSTPCPARISSFLRPLGTQKTNISMSLPIHKVFGLVNRFLKDNAGKSLQRVYPSSEGINWSRVGGQAASLKIDEYMAVDGISNVISVLEEIEYGKMRHLKFLECQACINGCVGGSLNVENPFIAQSRIRVIAKKYQHIKTESPSISPEKFLFTQPIQPLHSTKLDQDLSKALLKLEQVDKTLKKLPDIDCGACGAPSCRAFAEDIVQNRAALEECVVLIKKTYFKKGMTLDSF
ncbi:[Fe-Fe] hydrogenase large subunit C-terminal domain-containing protein [Tindallia californiensis]|uniref:Iron only hydrogenase large subunit, C-terminal domain n=1 Tax=Tindallia californiensis TaxID=159292 RepID=A0A1H3IG50_9FIRM|nr:[Fe-Fe] hydrogenase large subunit C-terminal domain-containing protein [Tindallia californiensis]SDY26219.1 Iron only hydrogenase large subunit, C-terminal domain [Tindallia californiensis]